MLGRSVVGRRRSISTFSVDPTSNEVDRQRQEVIYTCKLYSRSNHVALVPELIKAHFDRERVASRCHVDAPLRVSSTNNHSNNTTHHHGRSAGRNHDRALPPRGCDPSVLLPRWLVSGTHWVSVVLGVVTQKSIASSQDLFGDLLTC